MSTNPENNIDVEKSTGELNKEELGALTAEVMNNPQVLAAMQSKLQGMVGTLSGYYDTLPASVKRRVKALKKLQIEHLKIDGDFYREVHELEVKYAARHASLYEKRTSVVSGNYEPNDDECDFPSDEEEDENELSENVKNKVKVEDSNKDEKDDTKGIPEFWLTILKNVDLTAENIQEHDEPLLEHLQDIKVHLNNAPMKFTLEFHFSPNEYFTNSVLTKEYFLKAEPDEEDPWSYDGLAIIKCKGCKIDWKKGKNVTEKQVQKKQKHKSKGQIRTVLKTVKNDSFFNFFDPPQVKDGEELDEETSDLLQADWEIGEVIRQSIVPRAVLFFTGEALDDEDYEEDDEEDDEEDEDEDSEADEDYQPPTKPQGKKGGGKHGGKKGEEQPAECKQQ